MYELNDDGIVEVGFHTDYSVFPLATGNPDDAIIWEEQCHAYYLPFLPLPMSYGDQSAHAARLPHSQRTTVTFAGIIDQPSGYVQLFEQEKEVVGWGSVTIPDGNGASLSFEAYLSLARSYNNFHGLYFLATGIHTIAHTAFSRNVGKEISTHRSLYLPTHPQNSIYNLILGSFLE